jgi:hypothetical protein
MAGVGVAAGVWPGGLCAATNSDTQKASAKANNGRVKVRAGRARNRDEPHPNVL